MSHWLEKASRAIGQSAGEAIEPFEIRCRCGHVYGGMRRTSHQRLICGDCGYALFVLPANVYPPVKNTPRSKKRQQPSQPAVPIVQIVRGLTRERVERISQTKARLTSSARTSFNTLKSIPRRLWSPLRFVLLVTTVVVSVTAYGLWHGQLLDRAKVTLKTAVENGHSALLKQDFVTAAEEFERAADAQALLGVDDMHAHVVRQFRQESVAARDLLSIPLHDVLDAAAEAEQAGQFGKWEQTFHLTDRDAWVVMDAWVAPIVRPPGIEWLSIDFPLAVNDVPVHLDFNSTAMRQVPLTETPHRMIIAAQIQNIAPPTDERTAWTVRLRSQTAFLWSDEESYRALSFEIDEDIRELLDRQTQSLGLK